MRAFTRRRYISQLLIAVNPFKFIDGLYDEKRKETYRGCNWATEEPHVYAIAEMSYQSMTQQNQSQVGHARTHTRGA